MESHDVVQLSGAILLIVGALLPVVNPFGSAPIFLDMTRGCDRATRAELARRITVYSFFMLLVSMLVGLGFFVIWLVLVVKALQGERFTLPVIGGFAELQADAN